MLTATRTRKTYGRRDYLYIAAHYRDQTAAELARALGHSPGSIYRFIARYPELRKQGKS